MIFRAQCSLAVFQFQFAIRIFNSFPKTDHYLLSHSVGLVLDAYLMHSSQILQIKFYAQCTESYQRHMYASSYSTYHTYCINKVCRLILLFSPRRSLLVVAWYSIVVFAMAKHFIHKCIGGNMYATEKYTKHKFPPVKIIIGNENDTNGCYMLRAKFQKGHWYVSPISIHAFIHTIKPIKYVQRTSHGWQHSS